MKKIKLLPSVSDVLDFQKDWFQQERIGVILPENLKLPVARFKTKSCIENRCNSYLHSTHVVELFNDKRGSLKMKILKPCVNDLHFIAYHIGNKGIIVDKEYGTVLCVAEGNFAIQNTAEGIVIAYDEDGFLIKKDKKGFSIHGHNGNIIEKQVVQNAEIRNVFSINTKTYSWDACLYHLFIKKNAQTIASWPNRE